MDQPPSDPGHCFEVRLFYVRLWPRGGAAPPRLALALHPAGDAASLALPLRLDRHNPASGESTYVSTASAWLPPPAANLEVADHRGAALLRGSLRRCPDAKADSPAWAIDCIPAAGAAGFTSAFEVYVAGCCAGEPAVFTCALRLATPKEASGELVRRSATLTAVGDEDDNDMNIGSRQQYPEGWYSNDDDGQLTWFNAGVRVGIGIGLVVCVGVGIGVGLLMHSYQATARSLKRRLF